MTTAGPATTRSGEFRALTGLRIVAAVWVVLFHFHFTALPGVARVSALFGPLISQGALGVDLFFVLSGFVIAHTYLDRLGPALRVRDTARFVWARASRMWPVYVLVFHLFGVWLVAKLVFGSDTDIAFQAVQPQLSVGEWLQQVFMVQMWNNEFLDGASWVGPTWSLSAEWLAYLLFPLAALGFFRMRHLPVPVLALAALTLMAPLAWAYLATGSPYYPFSWLVRVLCAFGAGVLAYLAVRRLGRGEAVRRRASGVAATTPVLIAAGLVLGELVGPGRGGAVVVLFPLLVGALALADRGPAMLLAQPWAVHGGRISYCLYLVHIPVFEVFWTWLQHVDVAGPERVFVYLAAGVVVILPLGVASLAYRFVEEPARRRMLAVFPPAPASTAPVDGPVARLVASRAEQAVPQPRHAATAERRPTLAGALVHAQRRRPAHRAELADSLDRAVVVRHRPVTGT